MRRVHYTPLLVLTAVVLAAVGFCTPLRAQHPPPQSAGATVSITIGTGGGDGGGGLPREVTAGDVVINGLTSPGSVVTVRVDGLVSGTLQGLANGRFTRTISNLPQGLHTFSVSAVDVRGKVTPTVAITVSIPGGTTTTIDNLYLPPTIDVSSPVVLPQAAVLRGYVFPGSSVLVVLSVGKYYQSLAAADGSWSIAVPSRELGLGSHQARARASLASGLQSEQSSPVSFLILPVALPPGVELPLAEVLPPIVPPAEAGTCSANGDFNGDGRVNLIDFSIMLYYWGRPVSTSQGACADLSGDESVSLQDLSIMLYWWTN